MAKTDVLVRMKADTKEYDANIQKARKQLERFGQDNLSAGGILKQLSGNLLGVAAKFASFGAAASAAMKLTKDAFNSSEKNIDEWGRTLKGAEGAYDMFLQTLNGGNWANFFQNLSEAVRGSRDLYDAFDRLNSVKANNAPAIAILEQKLSQLRLLQQAGENVSKEIEQTTKSLSSLKGMSVDAGKNAGTTGAATVLRNALNGRGGRGISNSTIDAVVKDLMYNGQKAMDKYAANYDALQKKGMGKVYAGMDEFGNAIYTLGFNIKNLSGQQRRQYLIARAVTERETALAPYMGTYAQAVSEETATNRQEYKYNRYALQGASGGKSGKTSKQEIDAVTGSIDAQANKVAELQKAWRAAATDSAREDYRKQIEEAQFSLDIMMGKTSGIPAMNYGVGNLAGKGGSGLFQDSLFQQEKFDKGNPWQLDEKAIKAVGEYYNRKTNEITENLTKEVGNIASGISGVLSGIESLGVDLPQGMKDVVSGIQGVIGILTSISTIVTAIQTIAAADTLIPFANGGIAHAANGFVPGNRYSTDDIPVAVSSGELILNRAQQGALASQLQGNQQSGPQLARVSGEQIYVAMSNYLRRSGKGELITWR